MGSIYLVRHGRTQWNKDEVFRGQADIPLDNWGRRQAAAVGKALRGKGIEVIISSPLGRAVETATIARDFLGRVPLLKEPRLTDIHYGEWQGLPHDEVKKRYPQLYEVWVTRPWEITLPGGESLEDVARRAWAALSDISRTYADRTVAVFSHRVINKVLLGQVLGAGVQAFWKIRQDTACINLLVAQGDYLTVHYLNDTCHLRKLGAGDRSDF